jgi:hypothetical protein
MFTASFGKFPSAKFCHTSCIASSVQHSPK